MKICENCNHANNDAAQICINCKSPLNTIQENPIQQITEPPQEKSFFQSIFSKEKFIWAVIDIIAFLIIVLIISGNK